MALWHRITGIPKCNKINAFPHSMNRGKMKQQFKEFKDVNSAEDLYDKIQVMEAVLYKLRTEAEELDRQITCATALTLGLTNTQNTSHWLRSQLDLHSDWPRSNLHCFSSDGDADHESEQSVSNGKLL